MRLSFSPAVAFVLFAGITLAAPPSPSPTAASCDAPTPPPPPSYKAAFVACTPGRGYCGWSLTKNLGWAPENIAAQAIYQCTDSGVEVTQAKVCGKGCEGPSAHCAV